MLKLLVVFVNVIFYLKFDLFSVLQHEEFLELTKSRVIDYISDDDINVSREEIVYEAVKRWVAHDHDSR